MASISKNIKTLRTERSITQDELAQQLNVTRQTVSSWETNRTQPDIDMLESLAQVFGTDIEEIIYGKKRKTVQPNDAAEKKRMLMVILTAFGSLLVTAGIVLLFIAFWDKMGELIKTFLAFLPAIIGCTAGINAVFTKNKSMLRKEISAAIWIVGIAVTNALINSMYLIKLDFTVLLLADIVLILPVMFLLKSPSAYTVFTVAICVLVTANSYPYSTGAWTEIAAIPLIAASAIFIYKNDFSGNLLKYLKWVLAAAITCIVAMGAFVISPQHEHMVYTAIAACFTFIFAADKSENSTGLKYPAVLGIVIIMFVNMMDDLCFGIKEKRSVFILSCLLVLIMAAGIYIGIKDYKNNIIKLLLTVLAVAGTVLSIVNAECHINNGAVMFIVINILIGTVTIMHGIKNLKLISVNFGIITIIAVLITVLNEFIDGNIAVLGLLSLIVGILLLIMNKRLIKTKQMLAKAAQSGGDDNA